ncbi:MAG TPA: MFS transporter [Leptospiraceae bacterium]|nr:MFS transporter [Leptospirales bacterium]HMU83155.1 MFS transporter [Leptospiraceae bacterium]HMW60457.1 MFS transporter [Leptospiraceae bacterium]HMX56320.1 MFS transporter [Leptospiraceae bacterium]HMZ37147.1 MFS transporter [Leptospiraceae bacterium]
MVDVRKNKLLLIQSLLLDLIGFSLIFPLVPHLLEYYLNAAANTPMDSWLPPAADYVRGLLPEDRRSSAELIVLIGGILASIYSFLQFSVAPFWGRLSDRIGRRPVLIMTSCGLAASYLLWFFSTSFTMFLLSRVLGGAMAGNMGVVSASMADMTEPKDRTRAMGMLGATFGIGFILGPVIGGLSSLANLPQMFPGLHWLNPYSSCALVSVLMSIGSATVNSALFTETLLHPVARKESVEIPTSDLRGLPAVLLIGFLFTFLFAAFEFSLTFFYKAEFSLGPAAMGFIFSYLGILIALGQGGLVRRLSGKVQERSMAFVGLSLLPVPLALLAHAPGVGVSLLILIPLSIGASMIRPSLSSLASLLAPGHKQGQSLGVFRSAESLGRALGPICGAYLYWVYGVKFSYATLAALLAVTSLLCLLIRKADA